MVVCKLYLVMSRILLNQQNIDPATLDYPNGKTRDKTLGIPGTIFSNGLMGDIIQTFQKLIIESSITENDLPDNVTNGYQMLSALFKHSVPNWVAPSSGIDLSNVKFVYFDNGLYFHKTTVNTSTNPELDITNWVNVFKYDTINNSFSFNEYKTGDISFTNINANISLDFGQVSQSGNIITGRGRITINNALANGLVDLITIPNSISPPNTRYVLNVSTSDLTDPATGDSRQCFIYEKDSLDPNVIRVVDGSEMIVGRNYVFNFSYTV